ncbi:MAG TPA: peptide-methionine (S)-S-oxide reductase MsrA [Pirellulales bacterium]|nr:peptide-methionine (S)-S-oxide reductase MsrA [Pirellulales bacterium]
MTARPSDDLSSTNNAAESNERASTAASSNLGDSAKSTDASANAARLQTATFGAGCFWGVEAEFRREPGVVDASVGYEGGTMVNPTYKDVCTDRTGHAEVVQVKFDSSRVSYERLLELFFEMHDPTTRNRQGPDFGSQYRSVIFYYTPEQQRAAEETKSRLDKSGRFARPIVTQIVPAAEFYRAEEYHQRYLEKRGEASCHVR